MAPAANASPRGSKYVMYETATTPNIFILLQEIQRMIGD